MRLEKYHSWRSMIVGCPLLNGGVHLKYEAISVGNTRVAQRNDFLYEENPSLQIIVAQINLTTIKQECSASNGMLTR